MNPWVMGSSMNIRIVDVPPGEAPELVRQGWVGLVLPLAEGETGPRVLPTCGVLTGPKSFLGSLWHLLNGRYKRVYGYVVDAPLALEILAHHAPAAAAWWEANTPFGQPGHHFLFHAEVCQMFYEPA
jgi:hypothetical protein